MFNLGFYFFVAWRFGKKKPLAHHEKKKKSNHWTPSKLGIYPSPLSHLSVQKVCCSELLPTQCSFIAESTQIQCWSDGLRQNCYVQLHSDDFAPNTWAIRPSLTRSKWNMDEICGLKFHLSYVDMPQDFFWKFLYALTMSFLLLNLYTFHHHF